MGLQNRSRQLRFGKSESIAALLLLLSLLSGGLWRLEGVEATWPEAPVRVVNFQRQSMPESPDTPKNSLTFNYVANGQVFWGEKTLSRTQSTLLKFVPGPARQIFSMSSTVGLEHLPEEIQEVFSKRGIHRLNEIPLSYYFDLEAQGLTEVATLPPEVRTAVREGDYASLAKVLDEALPDGVAQKTEDGVQQGWIKEERTLSTVTEATPLYRPQEAGLLHSVRPSAAQAISPAQTGQTHSPFRVRYNPNAPGDHRFVLFPNLGGIPYLLAFVFFAVLAFGYCAWAYPRMKALHY